MTPPKNEKSWFNFASGIFSRLPVEKLDASHVFNIVLDVVAGVAAVGYFAFIGRDSPLIAIIPFSLALLFAWLCLTNYGPKSLTKSVAKKPAEKKKRK